VSGEDAVEVRDLDVATLRSRFVDHEFEAKAFEVEPGAIVAFALALGERSPRYLDPSHPDFQAPPTFTSSLMTNRQLPPGFPVIEGLTMNAGKSLEVMRPVRPGRVVGHARLHEIFEKTGRSGQMVFLVSRMALYDQAGDLLALSDSRQVIRERPDRSPKT